MAYYNGFKFIPLGELKRVQFHSNRTYVFTVKGVRPEKDIYVSIDSITIGENNNCNCKISRFSQLPAGIKIVSDIFEIEFMPDNKCVLNMDFEISFVYT